MRFSQTLAAALFAAALLFAGAGRADDTTSSSSTSSSSDTSSSGSEATTSDDDAITNPVLGQPEAIAAGEDIYRTRCIVCHLQAGGRGPNLFRNKLTHEQFLNTVINGRKGTLMPAFGVMLTIEDVWNVHAFVMSRDRFDKP